MITVEVTDAAGYDGTIPPHSEFVFTNGIRETYRGLLAIPINSSVSTRSIEKSTILQGSEKMGKLRDSSVQQYKLDGIISVGNVVPLYQDYMPEEICSIPYGVHVFKRKSFTWGSRVQGSGSYAVTYEPLVGWCDYRIFRWGNDWFTLARSHSSPTAYRDSNGFRWLVPEQTSFRAYAGYYNPATRKYHDAVNVPCSLSADGLTLTMGGKVYHPDGDMLELLIAYRTTAENLLQFATTPPLAVSTVRYASDLDYLVGQLSLKLDEVQLLPVAPLTAFDGWGDLALDCLNQVRPVEKSLLFLVFDVGDLSQLVSRWQKAGFTSELTAVLKRVTGIVTSKNRKRLLKSIANRYLSVEFGVLSCVSDVRRLYQGVTKNLKRLLRDTPDQRLHSRKTWVYVDERFGVVDASATFTVVVDNFPSNFLGRVQEMIAHLKALGFYPSVTDLWDILPYSFVVDWIADFGGFLDTVRVDQDLRDYFPIQYCMETLKFSTHINASSVLPYEGVSGELQLTQYVRMIDRSIPVPVPSLEFGGSPSSDRWVESGALVIQRVV